MRIAKIRLKRWKSYVWTTVAIVMTTFVYYCYQTIIHPVRKSLHVNYDMISKTDSYCHIPKFDPSDSAIKNLFAESNATCPPIVSLFIISPEGTVTQRNIDGSSKICTFRDEKEAFDRQILVPIATGHFVSGYKMQGDFLRIDCANNHREWFLNPRSFDALSKSHNTSWRLDETQFRDPIPLKNVLSEQYSVLMIVLDSMSVLAMNKYMPETLATMKNLNFVNFDSMNQVGENTKPNLIPLLMGLRYTSEEWSMLSDFILADTWSLSPENLILRKFAAKGYATTFVEDQPINSIFYTGKSDLSLTLTGKPAHYFPFIRWFTIEDWVSTTTIINDTDCRYVWKFRQELEDTAVIMKRQPNTRQFNFVHTNLPHGDRFAARLGDRDLSNFLTENTNLFSKTIIFIMGDHGPRLNYPRRNTIIGSYEEKMPFMSIRLPQIFRRKFPIATKNLQKNAKNRRLITAFDLHETLLDILNTNYNGKQRQSKSRGLSIFYPIHRERTCRDAGIPTKYCACIAQDWKKIDTANSHTLSLANSVLKVLNDAMQSNYLNKCKVLVMQKISEAWLFEYEDERYYKLVLIMVQNNAQIEAVINQKNGKTLETGPEKMSRLDIYGNQSHCIPSHHIQYRKFCICK